MRVKERLKEEEKGMKGEEGKIVSQKKEKSGKPAGAARTN